MTTKEEKISITKYDLLFESRLSKVETKFDTIDTKFDAIDHKFKIIDTDIKEIKTDLRWLLGLMISFSTIMIGIMAKGFHWI